VTPGWNNCDGLSTPAKACRSRLIRIHAADWRKWQYQELRVSIKLS
jgi:hypothetical protein